MSKRLLALILCVVMVIGVLPVSVLAEETDGAADNTVETDTIETVDDSATQPEDSTDEQNQNNEGEPTAVTLSLENGLDLTVLATQIDEDWAWDAENKILTLSGVTINTATSPAIKAPAGTTIILADGYVNTITTTGDRGIEALGSLTVTSAESARGTLNITTGSSGRGIIYRPSAALESGADVEIKISNVTLNIKGAQRSIEATLDVDVPEGATPDVIVTLNKVAFTDNSTDRSIQVYNSKSDATLNVTNSTVACTGIVYVFSNNNDAVMNIEGSAVNAPKLKLGSWNALMQSATLNVDSSKLVMTNMGGSDAAIEVGMNGVGVAKATLTNSTIIAVNNKAAAISVSRVPTQNEKDTYGIDTEVTGNAYEVARGELTINGCTMTLVGTKQYGDLAGATITGSDITSVVGTTVTKENGIVAVSGGVAIESGNNDYTVENGSITVELGDGDVIIPAGTEVKGSDNVVIPHTWDIVIHPGEAISETITISTVDELKAFAAAVNAGDNFADKTVMLGADIVFADGDYWYNNETGADFRITKDFAGTFDGAGFSIKNLQFQNTNISSNPYMYLFNSISGTVKNLTLDGVTANINGYDYFGFIAKELTGTAYNCHVKNVNVDVAVASNGNGYISHSGAMFGEISSATVEMCTAENIRFTCDGNDTLTW